MFSKVYVHIVSRMQIMTKEKTDSKLSRFSKGKKGKIFWAWVGYQFVKGILTVSFIWVPLIYLWFFKS